MTIYVKTETKLLVSWLVSGFKVRLINMYSVFFFFLILVIARKFQGKCEIGCTMATTLDLGNDEPFPVSRTEGKLGH